MFEGLFWRCHRRLVSDYLLVRGIEVHHIMPDGELPATYVDGRGQDRRRGTELPAAARGPAPNLVRLSGDKSMLPALVDAAENLVRAAEGCAGAVDRDDSDVAFCEFRGR